MLAKIKLMLLRWIYKTNNPPTNSVGYDGYLIYSDHESIDKFMDKHNLYPKLPPEWNAKCLYCQQNVSHDDKEMKMKLIYPTTQTYQHWNPNTLRGCFANTENVSPDFQRKFLEKDNEQPIP